MTMATATTPVFAGSEEEQALGQRILEAFALFGVTYAREALIRQSATNLATFLSRNGDAVTPEQIDAVVRRNPQIFAREERDGTIIIGTTRAGRAQPGGPDTIHTFRQRLYEPERPLATDDLNNVVTLVKPVITVVEPVHISGYWLGKRSAASATAEAEDAVAEEAPATDGAVAAREEEVAPVVTTPTVVSPAAAPALPPTSIVLSDGAVVDLRLPLDQLQERFGESIQAEIRSALNDDALKRVVSFGDYFYAADALPTFGKNDLRRIRDFILEQAEPLTDSTIMTDLYRERPGSPTFDLARFALDYRLSREKDFEFVGVPGMHLWSAKGLPAIGTKRLKASDIGQLYSYLVEGFDDDDQAIEGMAQHTLTFFEWEYGILPLNGALESLLPPPLLADQRTAVIRLESAQHYGVYLCELRYPTGQRGGWLWGLDEFFREYLVPGVTITLQATEDPTLFTLQYDEGPGVETKLLTLDEKRNRFAFMSVTYYARPDETLIPSQARYTKLRNLKPLPINERKKTEAVIIHVFETVGEQLGSKDEPLYWIQFDELWLALNVLRPVSRSYLEHLLASDDVFYADETTVGAYYYKPVPEVAEEEDEDSDSVLTYDDDEEE